MLDKTKANSCSYPPSDHKAVPFICWNKLEGYGRGLLTSQRLAGLTTPTNFLKKKGRVKEMINTSIRKMEYGSGYSKERLYNVHRNMIERCENHTNIAYKYYGGRGIKVCPEWHDYMKFREWAYKNGYDDSAPKWVCTIDRIDTNGDYTPNNCRWVDMKEQARNKRPYKNGGCHTYVTVNGIPRKKREVCEEYGISVETFSYRV